MTEQAEGLYFASREQRERDLSDRASDERAAAAHDLNRDLHCEDPKDQAREGQK